MKTWIYSIAGMLVIATGLLSRAEGQLLENSELEIFESALTFSNRRLVYHVISVGSYEKLAERNSILIGLSVPLKRAIERQRKRSGLLFKSVSDTYEIPVTNNFCELLDVLVQEIPEFSLISAIVTIYQNSSVDQWLFVKGEFELCNSIDRLDSGHVLIFSVI